MIAMQSVEKATRSRRPDHRAALLLGTTATIAYVRPYIKLNPKPKEAWRKLKRWSRDYDLPLECDPAGHPFLDPVLFRRWIRVFRLKRPGLLLRK